MIKVVVGHESGTLPNAVEEDGSGSMTNENVSDGADEHTKISLNNLVQETLADQNSDIGRQMRNHLSSGEDVPKRLIYTALKRALEQADPTKPVLIVDRHIFFPDSVFNSHSHREIQTQTDDHSASSIAPVELRVSNGISVIPVPNTPDKQGGYVSEKSVIKENGMNCTAPVSDDKTKSEEKSNFLIRYFKKMRGGQKRPPYDPPLEALQSLIVSFVGIFVLTCIDYFFLIDTAYTTVIGSFGATAVLTFCAIKSPLAQPRNVIGGHAISAVIGVIFQLILGQNYPWLAAALAVSTSIAIMSLSNTVHPPGGATALIAVYSGEKIHKLGFLYVVIPVTVGAVILVIVAVVMNNLFPSRRYPVNWY